MSIRLEDLPLHLQEQAKAKLNQYEKKSKYNAVKTEVDGIKFDSAKESKRYANLKLLERAGVIENLKLQPRFLLQEGFTYNGHKERKIEYVADFQYERNGQTIVEDVKSKATRTEVYKLKRKLFLYRYKDIVFREVDQWEEE